MWLKIKVLLWKSLQLRKRHYVATIIEIIIPCLLFFFINYLKSQLTVGTTPRDVIVVNQTIPSPVHEEELFTDFRNKFYSAYFFFAPSTNETKLIMKNVANKLEIDFGDFKTADNEMEMIKKMKIKFNETGQSAGLFGIVFEEINKSHGFKYKIRDTMNEWQTDQLFPFFEIPGPMDYGQIYFASGFLALQLALDKEIIAYSTSSNKTNDYHMQIQSYPYSKFIKDESFKDMFNVFLPLFTILSFLLMCSNTIKRVVEEKDSGVKELMKMMGLQPWMIWAGWILHNFFVYIISITIITYVCCFEVYSGRGVLLNFTNPLVFWIFLTMYMIAGIFFSFAISSLFSRPLIALIVGSMAWCLSYTIPSNILKPTTGILIKTIFMLLPNMAVANGYEAISSLESQGVGLGFSTLFTIGKGGNNSFSVGFVLFMFIVECFFYGFIAWYLDSVMPGEYGIAKPLNFLCNWSKKDSDKSPMIPISKTNSRLFEKPSDKYEVGMSVNNLYKRFGNFYAVNGVNMDLYKGQITALLGHNGAGKTTTMSIITGLFSPTSGSVKFDGTDLFSNIDHFRENLGLCPQHNLLFDYLTTIEHLIFFGMLKGMPLKKAESEGLNLLRLLNILKKKNDLVKNLSGGMKRKLSLAIALVGSPEILILDEPTSGMDPESRREMWDLLLSFRGTRTILITTHFMEEADVLGDRIAIMDHGRVKCYGTSLFLKKAYGTGYNLTIVKDDSCSDVKIVMAIKNILPEAEIQSSLTAQLVINLPNESADKFSDLFRMLEKSRNELCIKGMGISCTTMEEVFLRAEKDSLDDDDNEMSSLNTQSDSSSYQLIITKESDCIVDQVTNLVQQYVPEYVLMATMETQIMYNLPARKMNQFDALSSALEFQKNNLKLISFKITNPTTGDIYPNSSNSADDGEESKQQFKNEVTETLMPKYSSGLNLLKNQFLILLEKKVIYTYRRWVMSLVFSIGPIFLGLMLIYSIYDLLDSYKVPPGLDLSLSSYKNSIVYYRAGDNSSLNLEKTFVSISKKSKATVNEASSKSNIINDLLKMCIADVFQYRTNLMVAGDFNETNSTIIYNNIAIHTPGIAINLYSNALLQKLSGNSESYISTVNEPLKLGGTQTVCNDNFATGLVILWFTLFTPGLLYLVGYFMALPLNERVSGIKHLQMMTKLSPILYWVTCFIWDYFCFILVSSCTIVAISFFDQYHIFTGLNEIRVFFTLTYIYGFSAIFYAYVYSYFKKTLVSSMLLFISINYIIGMFVNIALYFVNDIIRIKNKTSPYNVWNIFRYISLLIPHFSYSSCISGFVAISWENNRCQVCGSTEDGCKVKTDPISYFVYKSDENEYGILEDTLFLFFSSFLYIAIILLFDYKVFARIYQCGFNKIVGSGTGYKDVNEDPDVEGERDKVDAAKYRSNNPLSPSPLLIVDNLIKKYSFKFTGVRGVSFTVSPGECFGLLGVNGAGKTTTFRILTGEIFPSQGDASIQTDKLYELSSDVNQYVSMIGYCPQFDAINDHLTGRETLKLMAILRGISPKNTKKHVDKWLKLLGLQEYQDRICGKYSGGNKRKLNTAMALIGDPPIVFLDEPTSGVDPVARRNLWQLLASSRRDGQAVILTSHSMDECEALCNRLTIMVDGVMKCIGNIQYLKNRYGQGYTVMLKLLNSEDINVAELKADIERQFAPNIVLKDEHKGLLHYHITDPHLPLSEIFGQMQIIKENHQAVEDYTVGDTTLEQVFIAFAKKQAVINTST